MIISSLFFCVHQFCETMVPVAIGLIVGRAIDTGDGRAMIISLFGLAGLFVVLSFAYRFGARIIVVAIEREAHMMRVEVAGHTDLCGTDEYNQQLSDRRARAVYEYLTSNGIDASRLAGPVGYGESRPLEQTEQTSPACRNERNRRTELNVQNQ